MEIMKVEVNFNRYCPMCEYKDLDEVKDPCNDCLAEPYNDHSAKPVKYKAITSQKVHRV